MGSVPQVIPEQLDDEMASLRLQAIRRIVNECKYSAALEEKRFECNVSKQALHSSCTAEFEISEDEEEADTMLIESAIKNMSRVARVRTEKSFLPPNSMVDAIDGLPTSSESLYSSDVRIFWSLLEMILTDSLDVLHPAVQYSIQNVQDAKSVLASQYRLSGRHANQAIQNPGNFI